MEKALQCLVLLTLSYGILAKPTEDVNETFKWTRKAPGNVLMEERVEISGKIITMYANSESMNKAPFSKSVSMHDYDANRPSYIGEGDFEGLLAIKTHRWCFITKVAHSFDKTREEAIKRQGLTESVKLGKAKHEFSVAERHMDDLAQSSKPIAKFCEGQKTHLLQPYSNDEPDAKRTFYPWPWYIVCFWIPFPIHVPYWIYQW